MMKKYILGAALLFAIAVAGCRGHVHIGHKHHKKAKIVKIKRGHKCHATCGHYRHNKKVYLLGGHHHRAKCGHVFVGGLWVLRD